MGATPLLRGVGGQFAAVNGKHVLADQAQLIADQYNLAEQVTDGFGGAGDEIGDRAVIGPQVRGQGHEDDVLPAQGLDAAAAGDAFGIGQDDDLQQQPGVIGRSAVVVVAVILVEGAQLELFIDQPGKGVLEAAGQDLLLIGHGDHLHLIVVVVYVSRHGPYPSPHVLFLRF